MKLQSILRVKHAVGALLLGCLAAGCGGGPPPSTMTADKTHIMAVAQLWSDYKRTKKKEPTSPDELKAYGKTLKPEQLTKLGITDLDKAFISPRDNEPYSFRSPAKDNPMGLGTVVYESKGVGGTRLAASNMGNATEMTDEDIENWKK